MNPAWLLLLLPLAALGGAALLYVATIIAGLIRQARGEFKTPDEGDDD